MHCGHSFFVENAKNRVHFILQCSRFKSYRWHKFSSIHRAVIGPGSLNGLRCIRRIRSAGNARSPFIRSV
ncbi:hypothetical protein HMPREF9413_2095 [Paenibacillus sp. HGF7]|nr:hypothetical protein HMPREF9413_2095 [Paenibacillus sp. HGF7]